MSHSKILKTALAAGFASLLGAGTAYANCTVTVHSDHQGEQFNLESGQCAVLTANPSDSSFGGCNGYQEVTPPTNWNDTVSSAFVAFNSSVTLYDNVDRTGASFAVQGPGTKYQNVPENFNDKASLMICD